MSGASESTLQELLQTNRAMAASLAKLAGQSGGGGGSGGGGTGPSSALGKSFGALGGAVGSAAGLLGKTLGGALGIASAGLGALADVGGVLLNNQLRLSEGYIEGKNRLSDLNKGLEDLPFGLGLIAKAMNYQLKMMEKNVETYQNISASGARFGGSLDEVRRSAQTTYLSMDNFAKMMQENSSQLLNYGATADEGGRALVKFNSGLVKSEVGKNLLGMGYTIEQVNGMLGQYSATMGGVTAAQLKDQKGMEASVKAFATELTLSAELEGKSREDMEKQMKERQQNAVRENMLAGMNEKEKQAYLQAENRANAIGGKGARDALLAAQLGLPPMTKEAQIFAATNAKASAEVTGMTDTLKDSSLSEEQRQEKLDQAYGRGAKAAADVAKEMGISGKAIAMGTGPMASQMQANLRLETQARNQNLNSEKDYVDRLKKTRAEITTAQNSEVGEKARAMAEAQHAGGLMERLSKMLEPLFPVIKWLSDGFNSLMISISNFGMKLIDNVIKPVFTGLFGGLKLETFVKPFKDFWDGLFGGTGEIDFKGITGGIIKFFKPFVDLFVNVLGQFDFRALGQQIGTLLGNWWTTMKGFFSPLLEKLSGVFGQIAKETGPVVSDIMEIFKSLFDIMGKIIDFVRTNVMPAIQPVLDGIINAIYPLWKVFGNIIGVIKNLLKGDFSQAGKLIDEAIGNLWTAFKELLKGIWEGIKNLASMGWDALKSAVGLGSDKKPETAPGAPSDLGKTSDALKINASNLPPMTEEAKKYAAEQEKKNASPVVANNTANVPVVQPKSSDPLEILRAEIQTLNNINGEILKAMRDTRDYSKSTANTLASNGNLFRRA